MNIVNLLMPNGMIRYLCDEPYLTRIVEPTRLFYVRLYRIRTYKNSEPTRKKFWIRHWSCSISLLSKFRRFLVILYEFHLPVWSHFWLSAI
ncbi:hypothetical protein HanPSC8_Chr04g0173211 [Helianthus annuus]|nr:hypothetical protein HanPSC8_Chr04g0173211 [Helianthus annuus]